MKPMAWLCLYVSLAYTLKFGLPRKAIFKPGSLPEIEYPREIARQQEILALVEGLDIKLLYGDIASLSSYYTRYHASKYGALSSEWIAEKAKSIIKNAGMGYKATVKEFDHSFAQSSVIVSVKGSQDDNTIVLGAHQDSATYFFPSYWAAPGADDNASGVACLLLILRAVLKVELKRSIEFHFYSAEEGGFLGSSEVFQSYKKDERSIGSVLIVDQIGYTGLLNPPSIGLVKDTTSPEMLDFLKLLIEKVCNVPYIETECGYECSDNAGAIKHGFPSGLVTEGALRDINKLVHTPLDTIDRLNFTHIREFVILGIAFTLELAA